MAEKRERPNLMGIISRLKLQNMTATRSKWKRRGSSRHSFMSTHSAESVITEADIEEEFIHASEFGDIPNVKRLLLENPNLNIDCIDSLGRTALRLAVKNEHLEVVEMLLERSSVHHIHEAVLQAISVGHVQIAETILKHHRYIEMRKEKAKLGDSGDFFHRKSVDSQFSPDITPMIMAAQKNMYEIIQLLLSRGETIPKPHKFHCHCTECSNRMMFDRLRSAKWRLDSYRGLSSEAYISLSSKDPILTAFELARELRNLSSIEKYFKREYKDLSIQLSEFVVKLLDRVRTQEELDIVINKTGRGNSETYENLARLDLALQYKEKKFVAHPSCQQRLVYTWYAGIRRLERSNWLWRMSMMCGLLMVYPFFFIMHLFSPKSRMGRILNYPCVRFICHSLSFVAFLIIIIVSTAEPSWTVHHRATLKSMLPKVHQQYIDYRNKSGMEYFGENFPIRPLLLSNSQFLILLWIVGIIYQESAQIYTGGLLAYGQSFYNIMDFAILGQFTACFVLRFFVLYKIHTSINTLNSFSDRIDFDSQFHSIYWLNADRYYWNKWDPINVAEAFFSVGNILSFSRISYILPANETLGPLQISLGRMIKDVLKFLAIFCLIFLAFLVGLHNLYWYYGFRSLIEQVPRTFTVRAEENFGDVVKTFRTIFWSLFGRGEPAAVQLGEYDNSLTEDVGYVIYGSYNIAMVTVLLNMLIAMMTRSFENIATDADVEWKYSRSLLYMEYINFGSPLPVPLNLFEIPRSIIQSIGKLCYRCRRCCRKDEEEDAAEPTPEEKEQSEEDRINSESSILDILGSEDTLPIDKPKEHLTYSEVMQRIIQRYIFDIQREAEVTEDDFEEIKHDISSFRYEMMNMWRMRETSITEERGAAGSSTPKLSKAISKTVETLKEEA